MSYAYDAVNYSVESRSRNINYFEATGRDQDGELIRTEWQADQKQEYLITTSPATAPARSMSRRLSITAGRSAKNTKSAVCCSALPKTIVCRRLRATISSRCLTARWVLPAVLLMLSTNVT